MICTYIYEKCTYIKSSFDNFKLNLVVIDNNNHNKNIISNIKFIIVYSLV